MTRFIKAGGISIILAVFCIFVFITLQTLPLFQGAKVRPVKTFQLPEADYSVLGVDEWGERPFVVARDGTLTFVDARKLEIHKKIIPAGLAGQTVTSVFYHTHTQEIAMGTNRGEIFISKIKFSPVFQEGQRTLEVALQTESPIAVESLSEEIAQLAFGARPDQRLIVVKEKTGSGHKVMALVYAAKRTLLGSGKLELQDIHDLTPEIQGEPRQILVNAHADQVLVSTREGDVYFWEYQQKQFRFKQVFQPFGDQPRKEIYSMNYVFGDVSIVFSHSEGYNRIYSLYVPPGAAGRLYGPIREFEPLPQGAEFFNASLRNKAFLTGTGSLASLRFSTTETIRWQENLPFEISLAVIGGKYDSLLFLDKKNSLHFYELKDPHPEAGLKAFFGKIWYEGYNQKDYVWQSTGGTDDFEPKLSMIPLIVGTFKGTFYALLFALPIALLAAVYTAQFMHPQFKVYIKPLMEIMASLPSVVLGFLAALWLAPMMETRIPSLILISVCVPLAVLSLGGLWTSLPIRHRKWIKPGYEWLVLIPVIFASGYLAWQFGPVAEKIFFTVQDSGTGLRTADFRLWWPEMTGTPFEQRNSLVVGFMMGFAVIPIIFTIAEDSLSNVPPTLISGSLALGASRWQTAMRVVIPTAIPGIFSGVMIGLGRAVGETMIVVMATGNTPIMDFNIFSGMRTLSANLAVELPEAPYLGTLYRTLFLGAVFLFLLTFFVNTIAEIIRQHLREKYKTI